MSTLTIVRGLPGTGKSTFAKLFGCFHVENDYCHVRNGEYKFDESRKNLSIHWCMDMARVAIMYGIDVIVSNTFVKKQYIEAYKCMADAYDISFKVYCMKGDFNNKHKVPDDVKKSMKEEWEPWEDEIFVYPNINQDNNDPCYRPYIMTKFKPGDVVETYNSKIAKIDDIR